MPPSTNRGLPGQRSAPALERIEGGTGHGTGSTARGTTLNSDPAADRGVWIAPPPWEPGKSSAAAAVRDPAAGAAIGGPAADAGADVDAGADADAGAGADSGADAGSDSSLDLTSAVNPARRRWPARCRRPALIGAIAAALLLGSGAAPTFGEDTTEVLVTIDGSTHTFTTAGGTVGEALSSVGIPVGSHDVLAPAPSTPIAAGSRITLRRGRLVTVTIDGEQHHLWTTAATLGKALNQIGIDDSHYQVAADRSRPIGPNGLSVSGHRLHTVTVTDGDGRPVTLRTIGTTVAGVLAAQGISLARTDRVRPARDAGVTEGMRIVVTRVDVAERTVSRPIPQPAAKKVDDPDLGRGNSTVERRGHPGKRLVTIRRTTVNGKATEKVVDNDVVTRPQARITRIGTKETGLPKSWSVPWDKMAFCESTGRWDVNTGNGTYGGLQFKTSTWFAFGGGEFASRADLASKEQQIIVAERLYAAKGLAPWHCARLLGWGFDKYQG